jgi:hypothetical protein
MAEKDKHWYEVYVAHSDGETQTIDSTDTLQEAVCILKREKKKHLNKDFGIDKWKKGPASNIKIEDVLDKKIISLMKKCG